MALDRLIAQFEKEMELTGSLATEVRGIYALPLDEGVTITIRDLLEGKIGLECPLIDCPKVREEALYTQMLLANLFGQGTRGAVLGLTEDGKTILLTQVIEYELDFRDFQDLIEDFINAVDFWREEVKLHMSGANNVSS